MKNKVKSYYDYYESPSIFALLAPDQVQTKHHFSVCIANFKGRSNTSGGYEQLGEGIRED